MIFSDPTDICDHRKKAWRCLFLPCSNNYITAYDLLSLNMSGLVKSSAWRYPEIPLLSGLIPRRRYDILTRAFTLTYQHY